MQRSGEEGLSDPASATQHWGPQQGIVELGYLYQRKSGRRRASRSTDQAYPKAIFPHLTTGEKHKPISLSLRPRGLFIGLPRACPSDGLEQTTRTMSTCNLPKCFTSMSLQIMRPTFNPSFASIEVIL